MTVTEIEGRLSAALEARAGQVTAADLRPPAPPSGGRRRVPGPVLGLGLAAALVVIACLVLVAQLGEKPASIRPAAPHSRAPVSSTQRPAPLASPTSRVVTPSRAPAEGTTPDDPSAPTRTRTTGSAGPPAVRRPAAAARTLPTDLAPPAPTASGG